MSGMANRQADDEECAAMASGKLGWGGPQGLVWPDASFRSVEHARLVCVYFPPPLHLRLR